MHDPVCMDLVKRLNKLGSITSRQLRLKDVFDLHELCESSILAVLKHEKELVLVFKFCIEFDDEWLAS